METWIVLLFFALVIGFGFCRGFSKRSGRMNVLYIVCITISLTVLMLRSLSIVIGDPGVALTEFSQSMGWLD